MALTSKLSKFLNLRRNIGISSTTVVSDAVVVMKSVMGRREEVSDVRTYSKVRPATLE